MFTSDSELSHREVALRQTDSGGPVWAKWRWRAACVALVVPLTAIIHQTIFFPQMCMLNEVGPDYTPKVIAAWLSLDPSLPLAAVLALFFYLLSSRFRVLRTFLIPFLIGFAPLSVWVWDIPFTQRAICESMHDKQIVFPGGGYLRSRHLYILGAIIFGALSIWSWRKSSTGAIDNIAPEQPRREVDRCRE
jgi:hypothetical protein